VHLVVPPSLKFAVIDFDAALLFKVSIYSPRGFFGEIVYFAKLFLNSRPIAIYLPLDSSRVQLSIRLSTIGLIPMFGHSSNNFFSNKFDYLYRVKIYPDLSKKETDVYSIFFGLGVMSIDEDILRLINPALTLISEHDYILIQPFVGGAQKWKEFDWKVVIRMINYPSEKIIFIGSEEDKNFFLHSYAEVGLKDSPKFIVAKSLSEMMSIANKALLCISNDSLLMQICALIKKRCVVFCGPSDFSRSIPNNSCLMLMKADCSCINEKEGRFFDLVPKIVACNSRCIKNYVYPIINIEKLIRNEGVKNGL
jgi:hypothetical protein